MLAAGSGTRLRPLTWERPKALCPVDGVPLVDLALAGLAGVGLGPGSVAVNAHHRAEALETHVDGRAHVSVEPALLGTGGAIGHLRPWLDGRAAVVVNADAAHDVSLHHLLDGWDGDRLRFLAVAGEEPPRLDRTLRLVGVVMPWAALRTVPDEPCSVADVLWTPWEAAGRTELLTVPGRFVDCGTPASYLAANLWRSGGATVVGEGALVAGQADRCVIWPGAVVTAGERLVDTIRTTEGRTVVVRRL